MTLPEALAAEIRAEAAAQNTTIATLATRIGVSRSALHNWTTSRRDMPISALCAIADVLNTPASELMARAEQRRRQ
jgi:transcriptional regulator with XRE-family HTH domain